MHIYAHRPHVPTYNMYTISRFSDSSQGFPLGILHVRNHFFIVCFFPPNILLALFYTLPHTRIHYTQYKAMTEGVQVIYLTKISFKNIKVSSHEKNIKNHNCVGCCRYSLLQILETPWKYYLSWGLMVRPCLSILLENTL